MPRLCRVVRGEPKIANASIQDDGIDWRQQAIVELGADASLVCLDVRIVGVGRAKVPEIASLALKVGEAPAPAKRVMSNA